MQRDAPGDVLVAAVDGLGLPSGIRILLAVSGGPDSMALLDTMARIAAFPRHAWELRVAHVNHGLRGDESDDDEEFVRVQAQVRGLEVDVARVDTAAYAVRRHLSLEAAARDHRYAALLGFLQQWPGDLLATGHTQDDQAETLILRLLRGTGLTGLGGMPIRGAPLIRPWLGVRHHTILRALQERDLAYRVDSSNVDARHRRNRVRGEVIPVLATMQPRAVELLGRTAALLQVDADYLRAEAERAVEAIDAVRTDGELRAARGGWYALHPALRRLVLRVLLGRLLGTLNGLEEVHIAAVEEALLSGRALRSQLPFHLTLTVDRDHFILRTAPELSPRPVPTLELAVPGTALLPQGRLTASVMSGPAVGRVAWVCGPMHATLDAARVGRRLEIRSRRPGDRVHPLGAPGSRKLQDVMVDRHIPAARRDLLPVVTDGGRVIWVPGLVTDQRAAVTGATRDIVHLYYEPYPVKATC